MQFRVLSHAGLEVSVNGVHLVCDPWLLGSCYWRSWWNYPPVTPELTKSLRPDYIYLTHLHWDHFHGPSLRLFPKTTPILVPYCRYDRIARDLRNMGFRNVVEVRHGQSIELAENFTLQSFHVGPVFTDSAIVIRAGDTVLLNANDAKFAGLPLRQILDEYPSIDFCLRSHSSANARNCMHFIGEPDANIDENEHYLRAFAFFMYRVKPRYAIPFASNSCLLHRDVVDMNKLVQTPLKVKDYFERFAARVGLNTKLQVMVSGDSWSDVGGFHISTNDYFENREEHLRAYLERQDDKLKRYYSTEGRVRVSEEMLKQFITALRSAVPRILRWMLPKEPVLVVSKHAAGHDYFVVNLREGAVRTGNETDVPHYEVRAEFPSLVLYQSIRLNMFSQAWISKRVHYYATRRMHKVLGRFLRALEYFEAEVFPVRGVLTTRSLRALLPRWREALLYAHAVWHVVRGRSLLQTELRLLGEQEYEALAQSLQFVEGINVVASPTT